MKEEFLKLLETDREFRHLVMNDLGLAELIEAQKKTVIDGEEIKIFSENL